MSEETRVAVITGGEGTLARHVERLLLEEGWKVLTPGKDRLDVTFSASVRDFFDSVDRVDLLVNQAAKIDDHSVVNMSEDSFQSVIDVSLGGAFRCSRAALKRMTRQRSGHLIQVGSYAALRGTAGQSNYSAAKAGLIALTKSMALEYGARNIRSNCVLPGLLETKMTAELLANSQRRQDLEKQHALGRFNTVEEAARFIVFLNTMPHVSGQIFQLDSRIGRWT